MKTVQEKNDEKTIVWQLEEVSMDDDVTWMTRHPTVVSGLLRLRHVSERLICWQDCISDSSVKGSWIGRMA
jgi:hypothetical protein